MKKNDVKVFDEGRCFKTIHIQVCENCKEVQAVWKWEKGEYYPQEYEWLNECYLGEHVNRFIWDEMVHITYIGYCSIECEIDHRGWPV